MNKIINKIKQFFKNIISRNKIKQLEAPKETNSIENDLIKQNNKTANELNNQKEKEEFFEIYNEIKNNEYNLNQLTEGQAQKVISILNAEINLKKNKLEQDITELNILKIDNRLNEKNRILELYKEVKNNTIDLNDIDKEDLLKIRKLLLEESKIQDEKLENEIKVLEIVKKVS